MKTPIQLPHNIKENNPKKDYTLAFSPGIKKENNTKNYLSAFAFDAMDSTTLAISRLLAEAGIEDTKTARRRLKSALDQAKAEQTRQHTPSTHADTKRTIVNDKLAETIEWPTEEFGGAPEKGKHGGLVAFLRRVWKPVIDDHNIVLPLSLLAKKDYEAAQSIYTLRRAKKRLPPDLFILVETELTEMRIATDPEGLAKQLVSGRRARAHIPGM